MGFDMTKRLIDADTILNRAKPLTHQHAHEIQPFGHLVNPGQHRDLREHADAHRCCGESLMESALVRVGVRF